MYDFAVWLLSLSLFPGLVLVEPVSIFSSTFHFSTHQRIGSSLLFRSPDSHAFTWTDVCSSFCGLMFSALFGAGLGVELLGHVVTFEMAGWHHRLDGHEYEWTPGVGDGQGGLACCDSGGRKESDRTEGLN